MLCSHGFRSVPSPLLDVYLPVRRVWPPVRPLLYQQDLFQELNRSLELMDTLRHKILEDKEPLQPSMTMQLEKAGDNFGLILDTQGFSPEELSVRQVGRKLRVSGRSEKKQEDQEGSYSYRLQEFRREFDLPKGLNPEEVTCCLAPDGKLHIQAARAPPAVEAERELTINRSVEKKPQQSVCSHTESGNTKSDNNTTQDQPERMD